MCLRVWLACGDGCGNVCRCGCFLTTLCVLWSFALQLDPISDAEEEETGALPHASSTAAAAAATPQESPASAATTAAAAVVVDDKPAGKQQQEPDIEQGRVDT